MRLAVEKDRAAIGKHVMTHYLSLVENNPDEYLHQLFILKDVFSHFFSKEKFATTIHLVLYGQGQHDIIASGGIIPTNESKDEWKLISVYVDKNHRRSGLATKIVTELMKIAQENGAKKMTLFTLPNEMPYACKMYEKLGFTLSQTIKESHYNCTEKDDRPMMYAIYEHVYD